MARDRPAAVLGGRLGGAAGAQPAAQISARERHLPLLRRSPHEYHPLVAKLVFGMSQSLDGYVDDAAGTLCMPCMPVPGPALFRHFLDVVAGHAGAIYGRRI